MNKPETFSKSVFDDSPIILDPLQIYSPALFLVTFVNANLFVALAMITNFEPFTLYHCVLGNGSPVLEQLTSTWSPLKV